MPNRILTTIVLTAIALTFQHASAAERPNIVLILADDLGWADTTLYGKTSLYETPNLERLAARGMTFSNAYAASPICSPTRGQYSHRPESRPTRDDLPRCAPAGSSLRSHRRHQWTAAYEVYQRQIINPAGPESTDSRSAPERRGLLYRALR